MAPAHDMMKGVGGNGAAIETEDPAGSGVPPRGYLMFKEVKKTLQWGEETLTLETGKIARQADGTVIATLGETSVMANVTFAKQQKEGQDFFPLTVHYQEKYYAAGKVPGGFFKREARPTEKETLTARLIDRPIRPLFVPASRTKFW